MFDDRLARPTICHATRAEGAWCVWLPSGKGKVTKHEELRSDKSQLQREWEKMETAATLTLQDMLRLRTAQHDLSLAPWGGQCSATIMMG